MRKQNKIVICEEKIMENELLITKIKCGECNSEFYRRKVKGIYYIIGVNLRIVKQVVI